MAWGDKAAEQHEKDQPSDYIRDYRPSDPSARMQRKFAAASRMGDSEAREMLARVRARLAKRSGQDA